MAEEMETLARYMVQAREAALPPEVAVKGKHHILDTLAAMVSGAALRAGSHRHRICAQPRAGPRRRRCSRRRS